ncbi:hypothetical protein [Rhizobium jaguaris]
MDELAQDLEGCIERVAKQLS